jgi:hypothetical protein
MKKILSTGLVISVQAFLHAARSKYARKFSSIRKAHILARSAWGTPTRAPQYRLAWCSLAPKPIPPATNLTGKYNPEVYEYCAGYQYEDKTIVGL